MRKFVLRVGCFFAFYVGFYYLWSRVYRFLFERRYRNRLVGDGIYNLQDLEIRMSRFCWLTDRMMQLWDAIGEPGRVEAGFDNPEIRKKFGNDCDEAAAYCARVLSKKRFNYECVGIMSVVGMDGGHNVCIFNDVSKAIDRQNWYYIGNWYGGESRGPFHKEESIAFDIGRKLGGLVGWSIADERLRRRSMRIL